MYDTIKNSKKWLDQGIPKLWCLCYSLAVTTEMKWPWWLVPVVRLEYLLALVYSSVLMTTSVVAKVTSVGNWITLRHPYIVSLWWVTSQIMFFYNSLFCHILFHHAQNAAVGVCDWDRKELTKCSIAHCLCSNTPFMFSCSLQHFISPKEWCNATIAKCYRYSILQHAFILCSVLSIVLLATNYAQILQMQCLLPTCA